MFADYGRYVRLSGCVAIAVASLSAGVAPRGVQPPPADGHVISGRVTDPYGLRTKEAALLLGSQDGESASSRPIALAADGTFITPPVSAGTYMLRIVRSLESSAAPTGDIGFALVRVGAA